MARIKLSNVYLRFLTFKSLIWLTAMGVVLGDMKIYTVWTIEDKWHNRHFSVVHTIYIVMSPSTSRVDSFWTCWELYTLSKGQTAVVNIFSIASYCSLCCTSWLWCCTVLHLCLWLYAAKSPHIHVIISQLTWQLETGIQHKNLYYSVKWGQAVIPQKCCIQSLHSITTQNN